MGTSTVPMLRRLHWIVSSTPTTLRGSSVKMDNLNWVSHIKLPVTGRMLWIFLPSDVWLYILFHLFRAWRQLYWHAIGKTQMHQPISNDFIIQYKYTLGKTVHKAMALWPSDNKGIAPCGSLVLGWSRDFPMFRESQNYMLVTYIPLMIIKYVLMVSTPLKNMKVSWKYYSQYMEKI